MIKLTKTLQAWGNADFDAVFKAEIAGLDAHSLPLQQGLTSSNYALDTGISVMPIKVVETPSVIQIQAGVFYLGIIGGCSCADDPTPVDEQCEYCEVQFDIDKNTADTAVSLIES